MKKRNLTFINTEQEDHDKIIEIQTEKRIRKEYSERDRLICKSTTFGTAGFFLWIGSVLVHNFEAVRAAAFAFISVFEKTK